MMDLGSIPSISTTDASPCATPRNNFRDDIEECAVARNSSRGVERRRSMRRRTTKLSSEKVPLNLIGGKFERPVARPLSFVTSAELVEQIGLDGG